jgi:hypothetical protein
MTKVKKLPTQERLQELFDYRDGRLYWRERPRSDFATENACNTWNARFAGTVAGRVNGRTGYMQIGINTKLYTASRLILAYHGQDPGTLYVDHVNGQTDDNRIENLRVVTHEENMKNQKMNSHNTSGVTGVSWHKAGNKWSAQGRLNGRSVHLGLFDTLLDAVAARYRWERENGFTERHGRKQSA